MKDRVREIKDVDVTPLDKQKATSDDDVPQAADVEEPAEPSPSIPDTCNALDHLEDEGAGDDESSFSSGDSFDDPLCIVSSGVFHISDIFTVKDVAVGDEENEDEAWTESLVDKT